MKYYKINTSKKSSPEKTAWNNFSKYIRLRDAIKTTGTTEYAKCITCGDIHKINEMDAGHAIPGRSNGILFDEELVNAQCKKCNQYGGGEQQAYKRIMVERHSEEWWDLKMQAKKTPVFFSEIEYRAMSKSFLKKYKDLLDGGLK